MIHIEKLNEKATKHKQTQSNTTRQKQTQSKKPPGGGFFIQTFYRYRYFNNKLLMRFKYSAGSLGEPPSAMTA